MLLKKRCDFCSKLVDKTQSSLRTRGAPLDDVRQALPLPIAVILNRPEDLLAIQALCRCEIILKYDCGGIEQGGAIRHRRAKRASEPLHCSQVVGIPLLCPPYQELQ